MRVSELTEVHRVDWERLSAAHSGSGFMQSWMWSEFKIREGYQALRLGLFEGEQLVGEAFLWLFDGRRDESVGGAGWSPFKLGERIGYGLAPASRRFSPLADGTSSDCFET